MRIIYVLLMLIATLSKDPYGLFFTATLFIGDILEDGLTININTK